MTSRQCIVSEVLALCVAGVTQTHTYCRFAWQAWHKLTSTVVLRGRRGTDGTGWRAWRAWTGLGARDAAPLCVAGVPQPDIHLRFTWQAWHKLTSTVVLRGRCNTHGTGWRAWTGLGARDAAALCVAGVAQTHTDCRFAWQAWHKLTSTVVLRGRRGTDGIGWRAWTGLGARDAAPLCVAGVAQPDIHLRFTWHAWDKLTSTVVLRGRRGTHGTGWRAWTGLGACDAAALCVSTVVLRGRRGTYGTGWRPWAGIWRRGAAPLCVAGVAQPDIHLRFTWQAWHDVLRGRRGTYGTGWRPWAGIWRRGAAPLCVAGVAQPDIHLRFTWQAWHDLTSTVVLHGRRGTYGTGWRPWAGIWRRGAAPLCVAGVAQPDIHLRFTWQAWHDLTSTVVLRGRRGTYGTGWRPWAGIWRRGAAPLCVAQPDIHLRFTWQVWHDLTSTVVLRGRRGTYGTGWRPWAGIWRRGAAPLCVAGVAQPASTFVSRGRRGTISHLPSFCVAGVVALMVLGGALGPGFGAGAPRHFAWQAWHNLTSTFASRGRRGTTSHLPSFCVAGCGT